MAEYTPLPLIIAGFVDVFGEKRIEYVVHYQILLIKYYEAYLVFSL